MLMTPTRTSWSWRERPGVTVPAMPAGGTDRSDPTRRPNSVPDPLTWPGRGTARYGDLSALCLVAGGVSTWL